MITVIIPVYNAEKYLAACLDSVANQTYRDLDIICVNDGSSDGSEDICRSYAEKDKRFTVISQINKGVSAARNQALEIAKGEYVCFIDSDDIIAPDYLTTLLALSVNGDFAICGYTRTVSELGKKANETMFYDARSFIVKVFDESITHPSICLMLFRQEIIQKTALRFTIGCVRNEDTEFYIRYLIHENRIVVSDYKGYYYRDNPNSAVHKFELSSLSFIEADIRISDFLVKEKVVPERNLIVSASVQYFAYQTARQNNKEIYNRVHELYDVRSMMFQMIKHPRMTRKCAAIVYLILGRSMFFKTMSSISRII